ncbi:MAG: class I tRNA ligase family protein [Paracoccaceae bacterium]
MPPTPASGSGAVKITGAHDFNDYAVAKRGNIPCYRLMDTVICGRTRRLTPRPRPSPRRRWANGYRGRGRRDFNLVLDDLRGLDRYEARKRVIDQITSEGLAVMVEVPGQPGRGDGTAPASEPGSRPIPLVEQNRMMQPHGDRSKVVIEPMLTDQWFVDTAKIVEPALQAVRDGMAAQEAGAFDEKAGYTRILPERDAKTYFHWLENIEPRCISRQLWWGHQILVWYGPTLEFLDLQELDDMRRKDSAPERWNSSARQPQTRRLQRRRTSTATDSRIYVSLTFRARSSP